MRLKAKERVKRKNLRKKRLEERKQRQKSSESTSSNFLNVVPHTSFQTNSTADLSQSKEDENCIVVVGEISELQGQFFPSTGEKELKENSMKRNRHSTSIESSGSESCK